jgi:hypothetical protein
MPQRALQCKQPTFSRVHLRPLSVLEITLRASLVSNSTPIVLNKHFILKYTVCPRIEFTRGKHFLFLIFSHFASVFASFIL